MKRRARATDKEGGCKDCARHETESPEKCVCVCKQKRYGIEFRLFLHFGDFAAYASLISFGAIPELLSEAKEALIDSVACVNLK
jgi:hypothetical protein